MPDSREGGAPTRQTQTSSGSPRKLRRRLDDLVWQLACDVAQTADDGLASKAQRTLSVPAFLSQIHKLGLRIYCLGEIC
jgi:hypothetical protein